MIFLNLIWRNFWAKSLTALYWIFEKFTAPVMAIILLSYNADDPTANTATGGQITHVFGSLGAIIADAWLQILGDVAYICMGLWLIWSVQSLRNIKRYPLPLRWLSLCITLAGFSWLYALQRPYAGGAVGEMLVHIFDPHSWLWRLTLSFLTIISGLYTLSTTKEQAHTVWLYARDAFLWICALSKRGCQWCYKTGIHTFKNVWSYYRQFKKQNTHMRASPVFQAPRPTIQPSTHTALEQKPVTSTPTDLPIKIPRERTHKAHANTFQACAGSEHYNPSFDLLDDYTSTITPPSAGELQEQMETLMRVLKDFGIEGKIQKASPGPVVTLYELELAPGIKSARVISLSDDIARSMSALATRVSVIPGRNIIGIELPNRTRETVFLKDILERKEFAHTKDVLPLALGKDIAGIPVVVDLARMPHLLVAGTTGSGKSVGINTMVLSLLFRLPPQNCQLLMIDPKMLELSVYNGIPHLISPVIVDAKKAVQALKWAVSEMERRYKLMSAISVRNIDGYNRKVKAALDAGKTLSRSVQTGFDDAGQPIFEEEFLPQTPLPYIVIIVDEMADLMLVAGKEIEGAIQRLAQMARAAGLHLIMATQRPSVDVLTGTIKANFPTRLSFQVTSKIDSRTILGEQGAEQLLGRGDMLYMPPGDRMLRVHGPFVSDEEVERVVSFLKQTYPAPASSVSFDLSDTGLSDSFGTEESDDGLFEEAVAIVMRDKKASTSYLQRRLQIGYNRAARLIEDMEARGIVSPANHAGKRTVLGKDAK